MNPTKLPFATCRLSACIALAFPLASGAAMAQSTFEAHGGYFIGQDQSWTNVVPKSGDFSLPATAGYASGSAYGSSQGGFDSTASVAATSFGGGQFGGSAVTSAIYAAYAPMTSHISFTYSDQITNTGSTAQQASFALAISSLQFAFDYGSQYGTNKVGFAANVYVDGRSSAVWSSTFSYDNAQAVMLGNNGYSQTGVNIGLAAALPSSCGTSDGTRYGNDCIFYSGGFGISDYSTTIDLGSVAAGQSFGIHYEVDLQTETDMYGGDASAYFNDPSYLSATSPTAGRLAFAASGESTPGDGMIAAVPEPQTYALMAAGLGLLAVARRRRGR